jgi:hypothetical protein
MPLLDDISDNKVLGREYKRGLQEGRQVGIREGQLIILRRQIEKRFGAIPNWAEEQLTARSARELEDLSVRIFDAPSIEDMLK